MSTDESDKDAEAVLLARRQLLARHVAGDGAAFSEFMTAYRSQVYSYLVRTGVDAASRDDLFQDIFIRIHQAAASYQPALPVEPWLFTIVANVTRSHFRKVKVRQIVSHEETVPEMLETVTAADIAEADETIRWLERAIQKLPDAQREAIALCCIKNLAQSDVAKILNIPLNTLKTHLSRARATLAKDLARRGAISRREVLQ
ncbi:MAG: RNA polymerase sigma factor [Bdellovibrionota bacterium]